MEPRPHPREGTGDVWIDGAAASPAQVRRLALTGGATECIGLGASHGTGPHLMQTPLDVAHVKPTLLGAIWGHRDLESPWGRLSEPSRRGMKA